MTLKRYIQRVKGGSINQQPSLESQKEENAQEGVISTKQFARKKYIDTTSSESQTEALFDAEWCMREHTLVI